MQLAKAAIECIHRCHEDRLLNEHFKVEIQFKYSAFLVRYSGEVLPSGAPSHTTS